MAGLGKRMIKASIILLFSALVAALTLTGCSLQAVEEGKKTFQPQPGSPLDFTFQYPASWEWEERVSSAGEESVYDYELRTVDQTYSSDPLIRLPSGNIWINVFLSRAEAVDAFERAVSGFIRANETTYPDRFTVTNVEVASKPAVMIEVSIPKGHRFGREEEYIGQVTIFTDNVRVYQIELIYPVSRENEPFVINFKALIESINFPNPG